MIVALLVGVGLLLAYLRVRRTRRRDRLAGLTSEAPTFHVAPPVRPVIEREEHRW